MPPCVHCCYGRPWLSSMPSSWLAGCSTHFHLSWGTRMTTAGCIRVFDSQGEAYKRAFQIFLDHTDQKRNAKRFLQKLVDGLPNRNVFIDAGAGNGEVTKAFAGAFCHTIAIEPNPHLLSQLKQAIPQAEAIAAPILAADPKAQGDFVLCSHTLYYIPAEEWLAHLDRLVS